MTALTIAIVDNDDSFLSVMHDLLTTAGYQTLCCRPQDVADAHAIVKRSQPALVILDRWWRRGNDGWEFLKHLWADPDTTHIGVVLTAEQAVVPSLQAEILRAMRCQVVRTPLNQHDVLYAIAAVLDPLSVRRIPEWRVAAMTAAPPSPTNRVLDLRTQSQFASRLRPVLQVAHLQRADQREDEELHRYATDERAARQASSALDAASDS